MFKKIASAILVVLLLCAFFGCDDSSQDISQSIVSSVSEEFSEIEQIIDYPNIQYTPYRPDFTYDYNYFDENLSVGIFYENGLRTYYSQNADRRIYPASLTKIVTASVALKYGDLDDVYNVGSELNLVQPHSSLFGLRQGMRITLNHLLYGLLLPSGNDAAYTIAVNIARGIEGNKDLNDEQAVKFFCNLMNEYCVEIGAVNSHFTTPEGWDDSAQYTTVNDLALITAKAMELDTFCEIVNTAEIKFLVDSGETFYVTNSNLMLQEDSKYYNPDCFGVKTGTTDMAGACLIAAVTVDDFKYILVATNNPTNYSRYDTVIELYEFAKRYHYSTNLQLPKRTAK